MNLEIIYNQLEELQNNLRYYEDRLEEIKSLITPQATKFNKIMVDGGKRTDTLLKYVEIEDAQQLESTIDYIKKRIQNLEDLKERELKRLRKYGETIKLVVLLKENEYKIDQFGGKRHLTWDEIGRKAYCSPRSARYWYKLATEERKKSA